MSEMIARVAKAMYDACDKDRERYQWERVHPIARRLWETAALAAIVAMREPTTEMLKAGVAAYETPGQGFLIGAYNAMINAALKE